MDNQQGPAEWHRELCSMLFGSLDGRGGLGENTHIHTCIYMAESLCVHLKLLQHCLLIGYTLIQIKSLKKMNNKWRSLALKT